jgi:hypothetical protein
MVFYYVLHQALPETERFTGGKRNCATFLYGTVLYAVVIAVLRATGGSTRWADAVFSSTILVWLADAASMAYLYKAYYGRSIMHEAGDPATTTDKWDYDPDAHRYSKQDPEVVKREDERKKARARRADERKKARAQRAEGRDEERKGREERARVVVQRKREIRAAKTIQRWWRERLYSPPHGLAYLRARDSFSAAST